MLVGRVEDNIEFERALDAMQLQLEEQTQLHAQDLETHAKEREEHAKEKEGHAIERKEKEKEQEEKDALVTPL
jgi:hypothetical protein